MAVENDFLPFATGAGANVLSQSAYAALSSVSTGYMAGVAQSAALNKTWRQSSIMAAVMAQFIVAQTGQTAIDDGTTATLLANFTQAVVAASKQRVILTDTGAANAYAAANTVPMTALPTATGAVQTVQIAHANTGTATYAPDGLAAKPIYGLGGAVLQGGELALNGIATLVSYVGPLLNSGNLCWVLYECIGGAQQVPAATQSNHAAQLGQVQSGSTSYAVATGSANAHTVALVPALTSRIDGMMIRYKAPAANTGAVTLADGVGTANVVGANHVALQGGEYIANGDALVIWNSTINGGTYVLLECTGGAVQVAPGTQSQHAVQYSQALGLGQTWQNLVGSRAVNTTYTNTTGKPIAVAVTTTSSATQATTYITVNSIGVYGSSNYAAGAPGSSAFAIVPPGATYSASVTAGTATLAQWSELR